MLRKGLCIATGGGQSGPGGDYTFEDSSDDDKPKLLPASHVSHATKQASSTIVSSIVGVGGANAGGENDKHKKEKKGSWLQVAKKKKSKKSKNNPRPNHPLSADVAEDSDIPQHIDFFASQSQELASFSERLDMSSLLQQPEEQQPHTHLTLALGDDTPPGAAGVGDLFEDWTMDPMDSMPDDPPTPKQKARKTKAKSSSSITERPPPPPPQAAAAAVPKRTEKAPAPKQKPKPKSSGSSILSRTNKLFGSQRILGNAPVESDSDDDSVYSDNVAHSVSDSDSNDDGGLSMGSGRNLLEEVEDEEYDEKYMEPQDSDSEEESEDGNDDSDDDSDDVSLLSSLSRTNAVRRSPGTGGALAKKTAAYASLLRQEPWEQNAKKKTMDASETAQDLSHSLARLDESIAKAGTSHFRDVVEDWNTSDSSDIDTNKSTATGVLNDGDSTTGSIAEPLAVPGAANLLTIAESEDKFREQSEQKKEYEQRIQALDKELSEERERNTQAQKELQTAKGILSVKENELEAARSSNNTNKRNASQANLGAAGRTANDVGVDDSYVEKIGALKVQLYKSEFESRKIKENFQKKAKEHEAAMALLMKESKQNERHVLDIEQELALAKVAAMGAQTMYSNHNASQPDPEAAEAAKQEWKKKEAVYHAQVQQLTRDLEEAQKKNVLFQTEWERRLADAKTKAEAEADILMAQEAALSKQVATMTQNMEDTQRKFSLQVKQMEQEVAIAQTESQAEADKRVKQDSIHHQKLDRMNRDLEETKRSLLDQVRDLENKLANTKAEALAQADNHTAQEAFYTQQVVSMSKELKSVKSASENGTHQSNALGNGNVSPRVRTVSRRVRELEQQLGSAKEKAHVDKRAADSERDAIHKRKTEALSIELEETRSSLSLQVKSLQTELEIAKSQAAANKKAAAEKEIYEKNYDMLGQELEETKSTLSLEVKELKMKLNKAQSVANQRVVDAEKLKTDALRNQLEESRTSSSLEVHELQKQLANAKWEAKQNVETQAMVYQDKNQALSRELEETKHSLALQVKELQAQLTSAKETADADKRAVETEKEALYETKVLTMSQELKKTESVLSLQVEDLQQQLIVSKAQAEARALDAEKEAMYEKRVESLTKELDEKENERSLQLKKMELQLAFANQKAEALAADAGKQTDLDTQVKELQKELAIAKENAEADKEAVEKEKETFFESKVMPMIKELEDTESRLLLQVVDLEKQLASSKTEADGRALDTEKEVMYEKKVEALTKDLEDKENELSLQLKKMELQLKFENQKEEAQESDTNKRVELETNVDNLTKQLEETESTLSFQVQKLERELAFANEKLETAPSINSSQDERAATTSSKPSSWQEVLNDMKTNLDNTAATEKERLAAIQALELEIAGIKLGMHEATLSETGGNEKLDEYEQREGEFYRDGWDEESDPVEAPEKGFSVRRRGGKAGENGRQNGVLGRLRIGQRQDVVVKNLQYLIDHLEEKTGTQEKLLKEKEAEIKMLEQAFVDMNKAKLIEAQKQ